jgi:hypothetical protein
MMDAIYLHPCIQHQFAEIAVNQPLITTAAPTTDSMLRRKDKFFVIFCQWEMTVFRPPTRNRRRPLTGVSKWNWRNGPSRGRQIQPTYRKMVGFQRNRPLGRNMGAIG